MEFPLISANIKFKSNQEDVFKKHIIIEKNGIKYGIFGLTTTDTVIKEDPHDIKSLEFDNPVAAAKNEVKELKSEGTDRIIALAHLGVDDSSEYTSKELADQVKGINLIVDGHSHSALKNGIKIGSTLIVSAGEYIENIGVVTISPQGGMNAQLVNLSEFSETDQEVDELIAGYTHEK
jgi:5'-nucleotidase